MNQNNNEMITSLDFKIAFLPLFKEFDQDTASKVLNLWWEAAKFERFPPETIEDINFKHLSQIIVFLSFSISSDDPVKSVEDGLSDLVFPMVGTLEKLFTGDELYPGSNCRLENLYSVEIGPYFFKTRFIHPWDPRGDHNYLPLGNHFGDPEKGSTRIWTGEALQELLKSYKATLKIQ